MNDDDVEDDDGDDRDDDDDDDDNREGRPDSGDFYLKLMRLKAEQEEHLKLVSAVSLLFNDDDDEHLKLASLFKSSMVVMINVITTLPDHSMFIFVVDDFPYESRWRLST